jgi:hypothetical protein
MKRIIEIDDRRMLIIVGLSQLNERENPEVHNFKKEDFFGKR